jgi:hypothetical protein
MDKLGFNDLSLEKKTLAIEEGGQFLEQIVYFNEKVDLYSLNNQFIEVYFSIATHSVKKITIADSSDMTKFISRISIKKMSV